MNGLFTLPAVTRRQKKHDLFLTFLNHLQNAKRTSKRKA